MLNRESLMEIEKTTTGQITEVFGALISEWTRRLITELEARGFAGQEPERFGTLMFVIECLLFEAFPIDVIIVEEGGSYSNIIREKLRRYLLERLHDLGMSREWDVEFEILLATRFSEYFEAWKSAESGRALERLAAIAWERILGKKEPNYQFQLDLAMRVVATFRYFREILSKFEVVE